MEKSLNEEIGQDSPELVDKAVIACSLKAKITRKAIWLYAKDGMLWMTDQYPLKNRVAKCLPRGRVEMKRAQASQEVTEAQDQTEREATSENLSEAGAEPEQA